QIVGSYPDGVGHDANFFYSSGVYSALGSPPGAAGAVDAWDINDSGQVVGLFFDQNGIAHGYLASGADYTTIDDPEALDGTMAIGLNDVGQITGHYYDASHQAHGFLETSGDFVTVDDPFAGARGTFPKDV